MATVSLNATQRDTKGTGAARQLRRTGHVPGIIYGHGREPQSLAINTRELDRLLDQMVGATTVVELSVGGTTARTLVREVQRHPFKRAILHIDFQELVAGEKVAVRVPLRFVGTAEGVRTNGGILEEILHQVNLRLDPISIPEHIDVDVNALTLGHSIHIRDLVLPEGVEMLDDAGATICVVSMPKTVVETPAEGAADATAEPELIRKAKEDADADTDAKEKDKKK